MHISKKKFYISNFEQNISKHIIHNRMRVYTYILYICIYMYMNGSPRATAVDPRGARQVGADIQGNELYIH